MPAVVVLMDVVSPFAFAVIAATFVRAKTPVNVMLTAVPGNGPSAPVTLPVPIVLMASRMVTTCAAVALYGMAVLVAAPNVSVKVPCVGVPAIVMRCTSLVPPAGKT